MSNWPNSELIFSAFFPLLRYTIIATSGFLLMRKVLLKLNSRRVLSKKLTGKKIIFREVKNSIITASLFGVIGVGVYFLKKAGYTAIYTDVSEYGIGYLIASSVGLLVFPHSFSSNLVDKHTALTLQVCVTMLTGPLACSPCTSPTSP